MGARDDETTQVTRLRRSLRGACAAEALELEGLRNSAVDIGRKARSRPSSYPSLRLALTPTELDVDGDKTDPEIKLEVETSRPDDG